MAVWHAVRQKREGVLFLDLLFNGVGWIAFWLEKGVTVSTLGVYPSFGADWLAIRVLSIVVKQRLDECILFLFTYSSASG
jgi:hypothetical protein